ncbi:hemerythrin-like domain-containing protein [Neisseria sp. HSC-16F19]|nr:hemerythrin domain-containing protein [Neisseria sp. HSC-16F19]MCP2039478.1 hemerythrin-like domain-containing protein [Neisseria sp. HSC-16F19]
MKRHPALQDFSREHHTALSLANRIRKQPQADHQADIERHRDELLQHFDAEEQQFLPYWPQLPIALQQRFAAEHAELRRLLAQTPADAAQLAELLTAHVRFEERELFNAIQDLLPPAATS